jgi:transcription elongation factor GreA
MDFSKLRKNKVGYGSTVVLYDLDEDEEFTYTLLMPEEIEDSKNQLSISSPIGKALLGKKEGDEVEVKVPSGIKNFEISELTTIHDK